MKAKKLLLSLAVFLLSAFVIVYIIVQLVSGLTTDVSYQYTTFTNVDNYIEKTGYIVRNETVIFAEKEGVLTYSAKESQKLGSNQPIATVFESNQGVDLQNKINKLDEKIALLERCAVDSSYLTSDVSKIDAKIYDSLIKSKYGVLNDNIALTSQYKEDLLISFNKRKLITANAEDFREQIETLQAERATLTASFQSPLCSVYCPTPGYFSTLLDGFETLYQPSVVEDLTVDSYHRLIEQNKVEYSKLAIGKIVTDFHWYTLCEVSNEEAKDFVEGRTYQLSYLYSSGQYIEATLQKIVRQTDTDQTVFVFLIEQIPTDFDYTRKQTVRIVKDRVQGIAFPRSALRLLDGVQGVYVVAGNSVAFRKVDIMQSSDSLFISREPDATAEDAKEYLSRFDRVITEGKNLYVGKILD